LYLDSRAHDAGAFEEHASGGEVLGRASRGVLAGGPVEAAVVALALAAQVAQHQQQFALGGVVVDRARLRVEAGARAAPEVAAQAAPTLAPGAVLADGEQHRLDQQQNQHVAQVQTQHLPHTKQVNNN